jgi:hypothetical protein
LNVTVNFHTGQEKYNKNTININQRMILNKKTKALMKQRNEGPVPLGWTPLE